MKMKVSVKKQQQQQTRIPEGAAGPLHHHADKSFPLCSTSNITSDYRTKSKVLIRAADSSDPDLSKEMSSSV